MGRQYKTNFRLLWKSNMNFVAKNFWSGIRNAIMWIFYYIHKTLKIHCILNVKRRIKNTHNYTSIVNLCDLKKISIWNYTQWPLDVRTSDVQNSYVKIWSYCSISSEVEFICYSNHPTDRISTYGMSWYMIPNISERVWHFIIKRGNKYYKDRDEKNLIRQKLKEKSKKTCHGPIIVWDDVRIWTWAKIMSWVHIWQWAVIAAWAVVTKDIPPYAIAWWVPAKVIKYRFSEDKIEKLLQIDYANTPIEKFWEIYPETMKRDFNIEYILKRLEE